MTQIKEDKSQSLMAKLLAEQGELPIPEVGTIIEGKVIAASKNEVHLDIEGVSTGVIRGPELIDESGEYSELKLGDAAQATVMELENENGELELSLRQAGHQKAWDELEKLMREENVVDSEVVDANKGGLLVRVGRVPGFLPVSQLTIEHYPRVEGGNKNKILEKLQSYIGDKFRVRVIDVDEEEDKMIVSEKAAKQEEHKKIVSKYKVGDVVEGRITGVVDFGAFIEFGEGLEGLVHISELAWQRIDNPRDIIKVGDEVKAQIISIDDSKISLSIRRLQEDPWAEVVKKYNIGDVVEGKVLKVNPFGIFVELDTDIHGLAHISELSYNKISSPKEVVEIGKDYKFKILTIEPKDHRLGLSMKALTDKPEEKEKPASAEAPADKPAEEEKKEEKADDKE
ncbi:MAG: S1 RNA-binding domain-containing protein [Patescibacteria group bacterium]|nr:S1 RNA-binding domain-containing protein [Patescibacteria group bacterium]